MRPVSLIRTGQYVPGGAEPELLEEGRSEDNRYRPFHGYPYLGEPCSVSAVDTAPRIGTPGIPEPRMRRRASGMRLRWKGGDHMEIRIRRVQRLGATVGTWWIIF
jgi:hypothetical protein